MPRKYKHVLQVTYCRTNDGNHYLISIRYNGITINGIRYTRSTENGKHQLKWPKYRLAKGDQFFEYPAIRPSLGFTKHVIDCIEAWLDSDKSKKCAQVPIDSVEPEPQAVDIPAEQPKRYLTFVLSPCCHKECTTKAYIWVGTDGSYLHRKTDDAIEKPTEYGGDFVKWQCPCGHEYYSDQIEVSRREVIDQ